MQIASSAVNTAAAHSQTLVQSGRTTVSRFGLFVPNESADTNKDSLQVNDSGEKGEALQIYDSGGKILEQPKSGFTDKQLSSLTASKIESEAADIAKDPNELKLRMLEKFMEAITGKKVKLSMPEQLRRTSSLNQGLQMTSHAPSGLEAMRIIDGKTSKGLFAEGSYEFYERTEVEYFKYESEQVSYSAKGQVQTTDGKSIAFDVSMSMSRSSAEYFNATFDQKLDRNLCDPLIINYGGDSTGLTDATYEFDLDLDGNKDKIAFAKEGSGFLALDKNGDGKINDGSELFGPQSGSGFGELAAFDSDNNGWIDENDEIYSQLRIWCKDENGVDQLFTLKEKDIGAIYLAANDTQFNLGAGQMSQTSFFLKDSGGAGTVSHVDLYV
ncbi:MAG: VCBS repeat-containing protein [Oscillospiraceae bacterium]|jgi:hypothetical protein|nr:VCBS repeat-containing protein [Oscillospiraceae bacterium]